jgi:hypothetical protein
MAKHYLARRFRPLQLAAEIARLRDAAQRLVRTTWAEYFEDKTGRRSAVKLLSKNEARRIAANIAKLPGLLQRSTPKD